MAGLTDERRRRLEEFIEPFRVKPGSKVRLARDFDPALPAVAKRSGVWRRRYGEINEWERYLSGNGFRIVKLFLNVSREEQRRRLLRGIDLLDHRWKFSPADVTERGFWDEYQKAYSETLSHTSTTWA